MSKRWRWKVWHWLTRWPTVCPANAHTLMFYDRRDPRIDEMCRRDFAANGVCWCGKLDAEHRP